jgi:serine/threonine protein kinase
MTVSRLEWQTEAQEAQRVTLARPAAWPDAVAYREVIQNPGIALTDSHLKESSVALDRRGLPLAYTGRFAVVFRLTPRDGSTWALRCFTTAPGTKGDTGDTRYKRYALLEPALADPEIADLFVPFAYLPEGVKIGGQKYPALAMQWADGEPLGRFVEKNRSNPEMLLNLAATLGEVQRRLEAAGIAHGDWQHDNLLIADGGRRVTLVDYDGVFVEGVDLPPPGEKGHPNYQHPARTEAQYGASLDRFPCLLMQTALIALAKEPSLWDSYSDGESLLFSQNDLADPVESATFATLRLVAENAPELSMLLKAVETSCLTGELPHPAQYAVIEKAAARLGVTLRPPEKIEKGKRRAAIVPMKFTEPNETATVGPKEEVPISLEAKHWFDALRYGLKKQNTAERLHMNFMRLFYTILFLSIVGRPDFLPPMWPLHVILLLAPMGTAVGLYFWPRNLNGLQIGDAIERNKENITNNAAELDEIRFRLQDINRNPAHLSGVAFVAASLKDIRLDSPEVRKEIGLTRPELLALGRAGVTRLSDLPADLSFALSPQKENQLRALKQIVIDAARDGYDRLTENRRQLQREVDRLESERQGLLTMDSELRQRATSLGDASLTRFVLRLFGL